MSTHSSLDRESFQQLLAAAFAVQESRMDTQSLSAVIQIQRLMAAGDLDLDGAMHLIANNTRNVADAAGVAIGLLEGRQLVYRAGIGSAAPFVGRHVTATLSVVADTKASREILRVENAQTDARIEAAICRQFGAESLLIMPICQGQAVMGVLEVLFSKAHAFQDREVRAYRLMAGLVGDALGAAARLAEMALVAQVSTVPRAVDQAAPQVHVSRMEAFPHDVSAPEAENKQAIYQICEAALAVAGKLPAFWRVPGAAMIRQRVKRLALRTPQWSAAAAAVIAIVVVSWSAYGDRRASAMKSTVVDPQVTSESVKPVSANSGSQPQATPVTAPDKKAVKSAFRRVRVGENEIDDVADDVTVRHFISPLRLRSGYNQVEFGKDVTVRYFASNGATGSATTPVASGAQPVTRTLPEPEKSVTPKLVR
jgi:hypothetical protein